MPKLTDIRGIDEKTLGSLRRIGIENAEGLIREGSTRAGRLRIGVRAGIGKEKIHAFIEELAGRG